MKLKSIKIDSRTATVNVDDDGRFTVEVDGDDWRGDTLEAAVAKARAALRKQRVRISIPATQLERTLEQAKFGSGHHAVSKHDGYRHLVITGMHGKSGNTLVRYEDTGKSEQLTGYASEGVICRRLNAAEIQEFQRLAGAKKSADDAYDEFIERVQIGSSRRDISDYVKEEIEKKIDTPGEPDADPGTADPRLAPRRARRRS